MHYDSKYAVTYVQNGSPNDDLIGTFIRVILLLRPPSVIVDLCPDADFL